MNNERLNLEELELINKNRKNPIKITKTVRNGGTRKVKITNEELEQIVALRDDVEEIDNSAKANLTREDIKYLKRIMNNNNIQYPQKRLMLIDHFATTSEILDEWFEELGVQTGPTHFEKAKFNKLKANKRYLISSAQTACPVNSVFFDNMKAYAEFIGAEIGIIATRYRNPTSIWKETGDVWDEEVLDYLTAMRQDLHPDVSLLADLKIQATSPNPTGRIDSFEGHKSLIVGAPCIEMRSVAVLDDQKQKFLYSTGSVTEPSFTDTVAGGTAAEHHGFGFIVLEAESDDVAHIRSVRADVDGSFNDLVYRVEDGEVSKEEVETLVWGDSHFAQKNPQITTAFRGLCSDLGVTKSVLHDIWDSVSINVHNMKDSIVQHALARSGKDDLRAELNQMYEELDWFEKNMKQTLVVGSNHDDMLDRAMVQSDWRDNLKNAQIFVELLGLKLSGKAKNGIIAHLIEEKFDKILPLGVDDSYVYNGTELALHGHKGPNGARGNINAFGKMPTPSIVGHSHSPAIKWNSYQVGVSCSLKHGYNKGLSGWAICGCSLNSRGARQLIVMNKSTLTYTTLY